jgi:type IV secretory pathway VirB10-like protein
VALAGISAAQSAQSQASASASQAAEVADKNAHVAGASQLHAGSTVQAELAKPVDARKNKAGDEVIAKTIHDVKSEGRVVIPKGSKLVGHVTEAKAHSKEQATSELGIAFDHAILKNGEEVPLALSIQAIGRSQAAAETMEDDTMRTSSSAPMRTSGTRPSVVPRRSASFMLYER